MEARRAEDLVVMDGDDDSDSEELSSLDMDALLSACPTMEELPSAPPIPRKSTIATAPTTTELERALARPKSVARVEAVCTRRTDLGDELLHEMARAQRIAACGKQTFDRVVTDGPVAVGPLGLVGSVEYHRSARFTLARRKEDAGDRALLVQTTEHTRAIETYAASTPLKKPLGAQTAGEWGENLLASGERFDSAHVCVGDELAVVRDGTPTGVRLRATSPRLPCSKVDQKFGGTFTARGVRAQCARTGWGGIFLRVLEGGSVQAGDDLQLVARPHPTWSLKRVSELLYGDESAVMKYGKRGVLREEWGGTDDELRELASLPELAVECYREELHRMLQLPPIGKFAPRATVSSKALAVALPALALLGALAVAFAMQNLGSD